MLYNHDYSRQCRTHVHIFYKTSAAPEDVDLIFVFVTPSPALSLPSFLWFDDVSCQFCFGHSHVLFPRLREQSDGVLGSNPHPRVPRRHP